MTKNAKQLDPSVKTVLENEAAATRKLKLLNDSVKEWEAYRNVQRALIRKALDGATVGKIGDETVVTDEPKDQFAGKRFETEYPTLFQEYTRIKAVEYLDVDALLTDHPDIAGKFVTHTFINKGA